MHIFPEFPEVSTTYRQGRACLVYADLISDLETPISALLKFSEENGRNSFILESIEGGNRLGRYSFIGINPDLIWRAFGRKAEINRRASEDPMSGFEVQSVDSLASLRALLAECRIDIPPHLPPMCAGLFGYFSYDAVRLIENLENDRDEPTGIPTAIFLRPTVIAIFDKVANRITLTTPLWVESGKKAEIAYDEACARLKKAFHTLSQPLLHPPVDSHKDLALPAAIPNMTEKEFLDMVAKAKEYILSGDIFQVVLSMRFTQAFLLPPTLLYRALRRINPSPFMFFFDFGDFAAVGASPEILVRLREDTLTIRPIAGTRRRGHDLKEDRSLAGELLADPKECAEHLMLLDLGRNDVGRAAAIGSVKVTDYMTVEYYSHVMHIVSNVEGTLAGDMDAIDAHMAGFPAGTVTGAPKIRAMEIIDELEPERRGLYAGSICYFAADGSMDSCIAIRTALVKDGMMHVQAGAGIVADSIAQAEYQECRHKANALLKAAEEAYRLGAHALIPRGN